MGTAQYLTDIEYPEPNSIHQVYREKKNTAAVEVKRLKHERIRKHGDSYSNLHPHVCSLVKQKLFNSQEELIYLHG